MGATGGEASVILTASQMPSHTHGGSIESGGEHSHSFSGNQSGNSGGSQTAGGGGSHNNMPPYLVVHMWKRIAGPETT